MNNNLGSRDLAHIDFSAMSDEELREMIKLARTTTESEIAKDDSFAIQMEVIKAFPCRKIDRRGREYRFIKSIVMTPGKIDKQNDWTDAEEIQDAIHEFMINLQKTNDPEESGVSYRHSRLIKSDDARIVECGQTDFPEVWGNRTFPEGTWKVGMRIYDHSLFPEIDSGALRGCSIEGSALHNPAPLP